MLRDELHTILELLERGELDHRPDLKESLALDCLRALANLKEEAPPAPNPDEEDDNGQ